jgi:hypothetical protein
MPRRESARACLYTRIDAEDSNAALKWYRGFKKGVLSLEERPNRCPETTESSGSSICCMATSRIFTAPSTASITDVAADWGNLFIGNGPCGLFVPQGEGGVHVGGLARGNPGGAGSDGQRDERDRGEHSEAPGVHAIGKDIGQGTDRRYSKGETRH